MLIILISAQTICSGLLFYSHFEFQHDHLFTVYIIKIVTSQNDWLERPSSRVWILHRIWTSFITDIGRTTCVWRKI